MEKDNPTSVELAQTYKVALDAFPEFAAQVGVLISYFAIIESYVHSLISKLTGTDEADAFVFSGSFMNFSMRVALLESLAKRRNPEDESVIIAKYFASLLREATKIRNRYAHGQYGLSYEGGVYSPTSKKIMRISTSLFDENRRSEETWRDLGELGNEVQRLKVIVCEIHTYVHFGEKPKLPKAP